MILRPRVFCSILVLLAAQSLRGSEGPAPEGTANALFWKAGSAATVITPSHYLWMVGSHNGPARGRVQDLYAKALALEDSQGRRSVLVTTDLIGVLASLRHRVTARVQEHYGLAPESVLLSASHTHSGPEYRLHRVPTDRQAEVRDYIDFLEAKLVDVIGAALRDLAPARLNWSHARAGFAMNRRRDYSLPPDHPHANRRPNPDGPVDHDVPVLAVRALDRQLRAVLFSYACHNTCLHFHQYHGDYAGCAQEFLEASRPDFLALFMSGCGADQNPYPRRNGAVPGTSDLELTQQHGRALANAVEAALLTPSRPIGGPLRVRYAELPLEYARTGVHHSYPVQLLGFGADLVLVALGSEVTVDYSLRLKRELVGPAATWVVAYANDFSGYIPSYRVLQEGGYEGNRAFLPDGSLAPHGWADTIEERIVGQVHQLHRQLGSRDVD